MNNNFVQQIKKEKGQGLMELIVAMGIIMVGLFSVWSLFFSNFAGEQEAETRMVASNLAREGLEAVKNLRDSNWLAVENNVDGWRWDSGFSTPGYYVLGQLFSTSSSYLGSTTLNIISSPNATGTKLYINNDGFYDHNSTGKSAIFSRHLIIKDICCVSTDGFKCDDINFDFKLINSSCDFTNQIRIGVDVVSEVRWLGANKQPKKVTLENQLFNWK